MSAHLSEFIAEQREGLVELMKNLRQSQVKAAREAAQSSALRIKSLNQRVRGLAKSGLRVNEVTHGAAQHLIELQEDIVTSALTDAAAQIERLSYTETARELARLQGEVMRRRVSASSTILPGRSRRSRARPVRCAMLSCVPPRRSQPGQGSRRDAPARLRPVRSPGPSGVSRQSRRPRQRPGP